jgi:hypothetical protein
LEARASAPATKTEERRQMRSHLIPLVLAVVLALPPMSGAADDAKPKEEKKSDYVKAEIKGTLNFDHGYFVSIKFGEDPQSELRVWLLISENKALVRQLEGLTGKEVVVKGNIRQMPQNAKATVPPLGLFFKEGDFTIEAAK